MTNNGTTLVLGATGAIGGNIVDLLVAAGRRVRVAVRRPDRLPADFPAGIDVVAADLTDAASIHRAVDGCQTIFNAAGLPEQWLADESLFQRVNVDGTRHVTRAALDAGVSTFVHTSTIDVFDRTPGVPFDESRLATAPLGTAYERSKQDADRLVVAALNDGLPARFVHPAGLYGPSPTPTVSTNDFVLDVVRQKLPVIPPGGLPLVHTRDVALGHLAAADAPIGSRYILSDQYITFVDLVALIRSLRPGVRRPPRLPGSVARMVSWASEALARRTGRPPLLPSGQLHFMTSHVLPDARRARAELGWQPRQLSDGLNELISEDFGPS